MALPSEEIKEKLDIVQFLRDYLELRPAGKNLKALCPFHSERTPSFVVSPERQIWHCFGCFPPGQKVKTPFGYHNIEDLDENHYVYSDSGNIRKILATHKRRYEGDIVNVKVRKLNEIVSLTSDHKLKIVRPRTSYHKKSKQFYRQTRDYGSKKIEDLDLLRVLIEEKGEKIEIAAGELRRDDFVMYPINNRIADLEEINLRDYLQKKYRFGPRPAEIPYEVKVNQDLLKLIGYYVAEGSSHRAYIRFSLGDHEEDFANEIVSIIKRIFNLTAKIHKRRGKKSGLEITACHSFLSDIFKNLCGDGASQKHIPFILSELPIDKQAVLLKAVHRGDGHSYIGNRSSKKYQSITTVSRVLAEQIVDCLLRSAIFPSLSVSKAKIDKLNINHKESYIVSWSEEAIPQHSLVYKDAEGSQYWLLPVSKINKEPYKGFVYNLTVDEDHSYITTAFAVGNCGEGGDIFKFLMKYENIEFYEALKILAEKAGIELRQLSPVDQRQFGVLYDINSAAAKFFSDALEESERAKKYLSERGLKRETIREFELGFASNAWEALTLHLVNNNFEISDVVRAGLAFKTEKGKYIDRFRGRIMFPIHNSFGKIVGFSGRVLPEFQTEDSGKYVNSPETPIFNKSRLLYGFWKSKNPIREKKTVLLVEGQMDFLMLWQDGVKNIVATSGTAVTVDHLKNLRKLADTVVLSFDNDAAGILATERAIDMAGSVDFNVNVLTIKDFKDPAEVVEKSPGKISVLIEESTPAMKYYFKRYLDSGENSKKDVRIMLSKVKRLWSPIDKAQWIRELAHKTGWPAKELEEEMEKIEFTENVYKENVPVASSIPTRNAELTRIENITLRLLNLISLKKELLDMAEGHISFLPKKYALIYGAMRDNSGANLDMESREMVQMISLRSSLDSDTIEDEKIHNEFRSLLKELELEYLKEKKMGMARDISLAQNKSLNDESLLQEFKSLINRMKEIQDGKEN